MREIILKFNGHIISRNLKKFKKKSEFHDETRKFKTNHCFDISVLVALKKAAEGRDA